MSKAVPTAPAQFAETGVETALHYACFDAETRTDAAQRLTFGSYRIIVDGICQEEGLFYADDLPECDRKVLEHYVATHSTNALRLLTRSEFLDVLQP